MNTELQRSLAPLVAWAVLGVLAATGCGPKLPREVRANGQVAAAIRAELEKAAGGSTTESSDQQPTAEPVGWGTLRGSFKFGGSAPERVALKIDKDTAVCTANGPLYAEDLVVGPDGGLRDVLIYVSQKLKDDEPWTHPSAKLGKTDEVVFDQKFCTFSTHLLALQSSQPIRLLNSDTVGHNANLAANANSRFDQTIAAGASAVYQPSAEERQPFPVSCAIHPWMKAHIITRNNSYFAVTKADGMFEIPNLPAGVDLEFRVWQERLGFVKKAKVGGQNVNWSGGKFKQQVKADEVVELNVEFDASQFK